MECKALYSSGPRVYLLDSYNWIDFIVLSMYNNNNNNYYYYYYYYYYFYFYY